MKINVKSMRGERHRFKIKKLRKKLKFYFRVRKRGNGQLECWL